MIRAYITGYRDIEREQSLEESDTIELLDGNPQSLTLTVNSD
jgi:hypothetical protein